MAHTVLCLPKQSRNPQTILALWHVRVGICLQHFIHHSSNASIILDHVQHGKFQDALTLYSNFQRDEVLLLNEYVYVALLKACRMLSDIGTGFRLHQDSIEKGFVASNVFVGSALVNMYAKCGSLGKAQEVFDNLPVRNVVSWNAIILGYVEHGNERDAINCLEQMQHEGVDPNPITYVYTLKACSNIKAIEKGEHIHTELNKKGLLEKNVFIGSTLVDLYGKCGSLEKAEEVFSDLRYHNRVTWNALITGYVENECGAKALDCFEEMLQEGIAPDAVSYVCSLKACGAVGAEVKGHELHASVAVQRFMEDDLIIGSALLFMYAKFGLLTKAQDVFDELPVHDSVSWTSLITGYIEGGKGEEALEKLEEMQKQGVSPCPVTLVCSLKACRCTGLGSKGLEIHAMVTKLGLEGDNMIGKTLVDMYAKCGLLPEAQLTFDKLENQNIVSRNALIGGYGEHGNNEEVLKLFEKMLHGGALMDAVTFVCCLKACGSLRATDTGKAIHGEVVRKGLETDHFASGALVDMYAKCGLLTEAHHLFDNLVDRTLVTWTALIDGYVEIGLADDALHLFGWLKEEGIFIDVVTLICSLKACGSIEASCMGKLIHADVIMKGFLEKEGSIGISLVDMYGKCGMLGEAQEVFDKLRHRDVVSWTALIAGYAEHDHGMRVLECLRLMQQEGVPTNAFTLACILRACNCMGAVDQGREVHAEIIRRGYETELLLGNTVVDMYAKCGLLVEAQNVFEMLSAQHLVAYTALIAGYAEYGHSEEALSCLEQMQHSGVSPDAVTLICSLTACGSLGALDKSLELHADIIRTGYEKELNVGNILIDTYARCGSLAMAQWMLVKLPITDVVSWNALIAAYALLGECEDVFDVCNKMYRMGFMPDHVTFVNILTACDHAGMVDTGQMLFGAMVNNCGCIPTSQHYTCMADLLGRTGRIDMAIAMIERLPFHPGSVAWHTVLGACQKEKNCELAKQAFEFLVGLDDKDAAAHVSMPNMIFPGSL